MFGLLVVVIYGKERFGREDGARLPMEKPTNLDESRLAGILLTRSRGRRRSRVPETKIAHAEILNTASPPKRYQGPFFRYESCCFAPLCAQTDNGCTER